MFGVQLDKGGCCAEKRRNEEVLYITSVILVENNISGQLLKDGSFVRDVQYDIKVSGFYDFVWEIFVILIQTKGVGANLEAG